MSFRELRNFIEIMKSLGYPRLISLDNFRTPNFELVADVLYWLVKRYDPGTELPDDITTENHRVEFLKAVAQSMATKAQIKLKVNQLYKADGFAVRELLKIAEVLHKAVTVDVDEVATKVNVDMSITTKLDELKEAQNLSSDIVESGSKLYTLLANEEQLKKARDRAMSFLEQISLNLESDDPQQQIERSIRAQIQSVIDQLSEKQKLCSDLEQDRKSLQGKIEKKQQDLERVEKRFKSLKQVKPAFMEEYEMLEKELKVVYDTYIERFRNLQYLESELDKYHRSELEKKQETDRALRRMQKKLREEELRILRGEAMDNERDFNDDIYDSAKEEEDEREMKARGLRRPGAADIRQRQRSGRRGGEKGGQVVGSMTLGDSEEESESQPSSGTASRATSPADPQGPGHYGYQRDNYGGMASRTSSAVRSPPRSGAETDEELRDGEEDDDELLDDDSQNEDVDEDEESGGSEYVENDDDDGGDNDF